MFQRTSIQRLQEAARFFPAVVLTGARQTGKTTALRQAFPEHRYVTLDLPSMASLADRDPSDFLQRFPPPLLVDEAQYAPGLFRHLKMAIDQDRSPGRFILTGSQKWPLQESSSESLAGRCAWMELEGLSIPEITLDPSIRTVERLVARGQMPELWKQPDLPADLWQSSYLATYLERDVRNLIQVASLRDFERFLRACAARTGQILNMADLGRDVGVSSTAVRDWLGVLVASNQVFLLEPWSRNIGKRLVKAPKLYLADTGMATFLCGLDESSWSRSPMAGALWETLVYAELRKAIRHRNPAATLWYYRDTSNLEVDFVVESKARLRLLEAKWSETPGKRDIAPMLKLRDQWNRAGFDSAPAACVCRTAFPFPLTDSVQAIPVEELGEHLDRT